MTVTEILNDANGLLEETNSLKVLIDYYGDIATVREYLANNILVVVPGFDGALVYRDTQQFSTCDCCDRSLALLPDPEAYTTEGGVIQCEDCYSCNSYYSWRRQYG